MSRVQENYMLCKSQPTFILSLSVLHITTCTFIAYPFCTSQPTFIFSLSVLHITNSIHFKLICFAHYKYIHFQFIRFAHYKLHSLLYYLFCTLQMHSFSVYLFCTLQTVFTFSHHYTHVSSILRARPGAAIKTNG